MHVHTSDQPCLELGFGRYTCNWGAHICGLHQNDEEYAEIMYGFLCQGAKAGDRQLACPAEKRMGIFKSHLAKCCPHCANQIEDEQRFRFNTPDKIYSPNVSFEPNIMIRNLDELYGQPSDWLATHAPQYLPGAIEV